MAFSDDDGAANNGFPRRSLHAWEGHLLHQAGYPCPPDTRPPGGGWRLSRGGVPIPPPPRGNLLDIEIEEARMKMTDEERAEPRHHPDNYTAWNYTSCAVGAGARRVRRPAASASAQQLGGPQTLVERAGPEPRGRHRAHPGRQLPGADDARSIEGIGEPPPGKRLAATAHGCQLVVFRIGAEVILGAGEEGGGDVAFDAGAREEEPASPPPTRGRSSGALVIRDQPSAPQSGRKRTKKEAAALQLAEEEAKRAEDAAMAEAIARSLKDLEEEKREDDAALEWARRDWERQEAEQQRRLLDLAAAHQRAARAATTANDDAARFRRPATPPSGVAVPVVDLESSDDDMYKPSPGWWGDAGQGSSSQAAQPKDDGSDDDDGDYTVFYRHLGM
ncbi:hypothetical protein QYE76_051094 [Lolium multiflorum]|uniref:Uncharacterized protein n=1 Tax=Lolium multiflorum TaxID=4521 RepID=A0AAD8WK73_LOLMU|nr:hypothetical protein QYE76_051094 [Lolium multiflorum]